MIQSLCTGQAIRPPHARQIVLQLSLLKTENSALKT